MAENAGTREARVFGQARAALRKLVASGPAGGTGQALLGEEFKSGRWGYTFMRRLLDQQLLVTKEQRDTRATVFVATDSLSELIEDDERLAESIWPRLGRFRFQSGVTKESETDELDDEEHPETLPSSAQPTLTPAPQVPAEDDPESYDLEADQSQYTERQLLEAAVKICAATLENAVATQALVASLQEQLDSVKDELEKLRRAWE